MAEETLYEEIETGGDPDPLGLRKKSAAAKSKPDPLGLRGKLPAKSPQLKQETGPVFKRMSDWLAIPQGYEPMVQENAVNEHNTQVSESSKRVQAHLSDIDNSVKNLIYEKKKDLIGRIKSEQLGFNPSEQGPVNFQAKQLAQKERHDVYISPNEVEGFKQGMNQNPIMLRQGLAQKAKDLESKDKVAANQLKADVYRLDRQNNPEKESKIAKNIDKINQGEYDYDVVRGILIKPEGFFSSVITGYKEKVDAFKDYDVYRSGNEAKMLETIKKRLKEDPDEAIRVPVGVDGEAGRMLGGTPLKPLIGGAIAGFAGPEAAVAAGAAITAPEMYKLTFGSVLPHNYAEIKKNNPELSDSEALQQAIDLSDNQANTDALSGAAMGVLGGKVGLKPTGLNTVLLQKSLSSALTQLGETATKKTLEGLGIGTVGAAGQLVKNLMATQAGLNVDESEGLTHQLVGGLGMTIGMTMIAKFPEVLKTKTYNQLLQSFKGVPKEAIEANLNQLQEVRQITPEQAQQAQKTIQEHQAIDNSIKPNVPEADRLKVQQLIKKRNELEASLETEDKAYHADTKEQIKSLNEQISNISKGVERGELQKIVDKESENVEGYVKDALVNASENDLKRYFKEIAEQASDPNSEATTIATFGENIVNKARELYPKEQLKESKISVLQPGEIKQHEIITIKSKSVEGNPLKDIESTKNAIRKLDKESIRKLEDLASTKEYYIRQSDHINEDLKRGWSSWSYGLEGIEATENQIERYKQDAIENDKPFYISGFELWGDDIKRADIRELYPNYWVLVDDTRGGGLSVNSLKSKNRIEALNEAKTHKMDLGEGESTDASDLKVIASEGNLHILERRWEDVKGEEGISEAYHEAKAKGNNPELVKRIEELFDIKPKENAIPERNPLIDVESTKTALDEQIKKNPELGKRLREVANKDTQYSREETNKAYSYMNEEAERILDDDKRRGGTDGEGNNNVMELDYNYHSKRLIEKYIEGLTKADGGKGSSKYYLTNKKINGKDVVIRVSDHEGYSDAGYKSAHGRTGIEAYDRSIQSESPKYVISIIVEHNKKGVREDFNISIDNERDIANIKLKGIDNENSLQNALSYIDDEINDLLYDTDVANAYHSAKKEGNNPELVNEVEKLFNIKSKEDESLRQRSPEATNVDETSRNRPQIESGVSESGETAIPQEGQPEVQPKGDAEGKEKVNEGPDWVFGKQEGDPKMVGITHRQMDALAEELGLPTYEKDPESLALWDKQAKERFAKDPDALNKLITKLRNGDGVDKVETRMMIMHIADLVAKYEKNPTHELLRQINRTKNLFNISGREKGKELVARKGSVSVEESLADFHQRDVEANHGAPLTPKQEAQSTKEYNEIKAAKDALAKKISELESENAKLKADAEVKKIVTVSKKSTKKRSHEDLVKERKSLIEQLKQQKEEHLKKMKDQGTQQMGATGFVLTQDMVVILGKIVKNVIEDGVIQLKDIVKLVHEEVKDVLDGITEKDIHNVIAGEYAEKKPSRNKLSQLLYDAKKEAQLINQLEQLSRGEIPKSEKKQKQRNQKIEKLRNAIKELRDEMGLDEKSEEQKLTSLKGKYKKIIIELEQKIADGDYGSEIKKEPLKLDKEAKDLRDKYLELKESRKIRLLKEEYSNRGLGKKALSEVGKAVKTGRTLQSTFDVSYAFRQTLPGLSRQLLSFPFKKNAEGKFIFTGFKQQKQLWQQLKRMYESYGSEKILRREMADITESPRYPTAEKAGLKINDPNSPLERLKQEEFQASYAEKIPIVKEGVKASHRAATVIANKMKWDIFNNFVDSFERQGRTIENSPEFYKQAAIYANKLVGQGYLGQKVEMASPLIGHLVYSLKLNASRLQLLTDFMNPLFYKRVPPEIRVAYFKDMAKTVILGSTALVLANAAGLEVELDPRSSDFGTIKWGDTRIDVWGGFKQYVVLATRLLSASTKSPETGQIKDLVLPFSGEKVKYGDKTYGDVISRFLRTKASPEAGTVVDVLYGQSFDYKPVTLKEEVINYFAPLLAKDIYQVYKDKDVMSALLVFLLASHGVGVQTFDKEEGGSGGGAGATHTIKKDIHKTRSRKIKHLKQ